MTNNTNVISSIDKEASERKTKLSNVDTSSYKNIIYNKKEIAINLFDEFDKQILNISNNIKRNYLIKNVVYKLDKKIIEVQVNQSDILISFYKDIKQFDYENKLSIRKVIIIEMKSSSITIINNWKINKSIMNHSHSIPQNNKSSKFCP